MATAKVNRRKKKAAVVETTKRKPGSIANIMKRGRTGVNPRAVTGPRKPGAVGGGGGKKKKRGSSKS